MTGAQLALAALPILLTWIDNRQRRGGGKRRGGKRRGRKQRRG